MNSALTYDVIIVGAGPAGTCCALELLDSGLKVLLIDKDSFPRDKICGDTLPGGAFKALDAIRPEWGQELKDFLRGNQVRSTTFCLDGEAALQFDWVNFAGTKERVDLDNFLLSLVKQHTQTELKEGVRLQNLTETDSGCRCSLSDGTEVLGKLVIACDGANSVVRRKLVPANEFDSNRCTAVRAYVSGVEGMQEGTNEIHYVRQYKQGYFWIFPLEGGKANIGFGMLESPKDKDKLKMREVLLDIVQKHPKLAPRFQSATWLSEVKGFALPLGMQEYTISGNHFMLCGDAASLVSPLGGEGIHHAMWSGLLAAQQAKACFSSDRFDAEFMLQYKKEVYRKIGPELRKGKWLMKSFSHMPWLQNALLGMARRYPEGMKRVAKALKL